MSTDTTPADHGRRLLGADDPAELLAEAFLCLHERPVDCLLLSMGGEGVRPALITRSPLHHLLGEGGAENLGRHLALVRERGAGAVQALIVLGDGHQDLLAPVVRDILRRAGALVLDAARARDDEDPVLVSVRGAAAGTSWILHRDGGPRSSAGVRLTDCGPLREFAETRAAASAVLHGQRIPSACSHTRELSRIGEGLTLPSVDLSSTADPGALFATARAALAALLVDTGTMTPEDRMTKYEQLAALLSALAVDRLHWELLARCVERGSARAIDRESLLQQLVGDASWRPHSDVCAGGDWYVGLEQMRIVAASAVSAHEPARRSTARSAWRALTTLLVLLSWWNHRFATAGDLVDELREQEPESTLAPLLSRMTDTPIFPAWWPSA